MSAESRLFIWPKGHSAKVEEIKQVVLNLGLGHAVKPFWYDVNTSVGAERVLVLEAGFENSPVIEYIRPMKREQLREAVEWALGIRKDSMGARKPIDTMRRIFGEDLVEVSGGGEDAAREFRDQFA